MSHQDISVVRKCSELLRVMQWLFTGISWRKKLHCKCTWGFRWLAMTAMFWAWSREETLQERYFCAQRLTIEIQKVGKSPTSWQAFVEILGRHSKYMVEQLTVAFRMRMEEFHKHWKTGGFVVFGIDGTDFATPRTESNEEAFTTDGKSPYQKRKKNNSKQAKKLRRSPRILMTTLFHIGLGLPYAWRLGSKSDNERSQVLDMLDLLPSQSLLVGDAGFVGYAFLSQVLEKGVSFLIRVGSNVNLLKKLGYVRESAGIVYVWPSHTMKQSQPPLVLRLIQLQGPRHPIFVVTNVLDSKKLSDKQVQAIYRSRWDIELYHRNLKQTHGRRKLKSRKASNALTELNWIVLSFWGMMLYTTSQFLEMGQSPEQISAAGVLKAFTQAARDYMHPVETKLRLKKLIRLAQKDTYQRKGSKESRNYPRKRQHQPTGPPKITNANKAQRRAAKEVKRSLTA